MHDDDYAEADEIAQSFGYATYSDALDALAARFGYDDYDEFFEDITTAPDTFYPEMTNAEMTLWEA